MRWTNPSRSGFTQSQQFSKNQLNRNPRPTQFKETDFSTQKNLIYDLRSELNNLRNQFDRLTNKPLQTESKQRRQSFDFSSETFESATSAPFPQRYSFHEKQKNVSHLDSIINTKKRHNENQFTPLGKGHCRSSSFTSTDKNTPQPIQISNNNNDLFSENQIHKIGPFKQSVQNEKSYERGNNCIRSSLNDQTFQKQKQRQYLKIKFQQNSFTPIQKDSEKCYIKQIIASQQLDPKIADLERQLKEKEQENQQAKQKIQTLTEQIGQISSTKIKQLESMREALAKAKEELKTQLQQEKQKLNNKCENERVKNENMLEKVREENKILQKQMLNMKEIYENQIQNERKKLKDEHFEKLKHDQKVHEKEIQKLHENLYRKNQFIKDLLSQRELQQEQMAANEEKQQEIPKSQFGVNTQEEYPQKTEEQETVPKQEQIEKNKELSGKLEEKQKQIKNLHQKIKLYLNNIDKQSGKLREYKAQIEHSQNFVAQSEFIIKDKENCIHNILNQLKNAEKEIQDQRMARRALECLLQDSNEELFIHKIRCMDSKYSFQE